MKRNHDFQPVSEYSLTPKRALVLGEGGRTGFRSASTLVFINKPSKVKIEPSEPSPNELLKRDCFHPQNCTGLSQRMSDAPLDLGPKIPGCGLGNGEWRPDSVTGAGR